jgi:hypothetical protein
MISRVRSRTTEVCFLDSRTPSGCGAWCVRRRSVGRVFLAILLVAFIGCQCKPPPPRRPTTTDILLAVASGLTPPVTDEILKSTVTPPAGWKPDPLKASDKHRHRVWLSPTGDTAYGVIYFDLPLPVGVDLALWGFLKQMKSTQGEANLLFRRNDNTLPGLRFVAEGGPYTIRCKLQVDGFHGWVVYAGTLRSRPVNVKELRTAEFAREQTRVDLP